MPSRHNTQCHRHDNWAVANTTRYPEGATSRTLTGPEGTRRLTEGGQSRGGNEARRERPKSKQPIHQKQNKATEEKTTAKTKGQQEPRDTTNKSHTENTRSARHGTQRDNQSRPKQTGRTIQAPTHHLEKENRQGRNQENKRPISQSIAQTGGQTKCDNEKKRIKEYECTCPVCGQKHKYKNGQDLFVRRENRNKCTNVPVQFAGMHAGMHAVQKRSPALIPPTPCVLSQRFNTLVPMK